MKNFIKNHKEIPTRILGVTPTSIRGRTNGEIPRRFVGVLRGFLEVIFKLIPGEMLKGTHRGSFAAIFEKIFGEIYGEIVNSLLYGIHKLDEFLETSLEKLMEKFLREFSR